MEDIKVLNLRLIDYYSYCNGIYPNWRVVFSDDEIEKRWISHTKDGWPLLNPEVAEKYKYRHYIKSKWILERCVPVTGDTDLVEPFSYEPVFVFQNAKGEALPPLWSVIQIVIDSIYTRAAMAVNAAEAHVPLYKHPLAGKSTKEQLEMRQQELEEIKAYFYANETEVGDALATDNAIVVPRNYEKVH